MWIFAVEWAKYFIHSVSVASASREIYSSLPLASVTSFHKPYLIGAAKATLLSFFLSIKVTWSMPHSKVSMCG